MPIKFLNEFRASRCHAQALKLDAKGQGDLALAKYFEALKWDEQRANTHYDIGLIYKYRNRWADSFKHNKRAVELAPNDEASNWNLAIAATALRDWRTARQVWNSLGMKIELGDTEIDGNFGATPVRLNADEDGEVVWARRVDPVRARINNVPFPSSNFRYGDIVLHDGAAEGYRLDSDKNERAVFNVLELFAPSGFSTYEADLTVASQKDVEDLELLCDEAQMPFEDWTQSVRFLCRECSAGRPYDSHNHPQTEWNPKRAVGFGVTDRQDSIEAILNSWASEGRSYGNLELALAPPTPRGD